MVSSNRLERASCQYWHSIRENEGDLHELKPDIAQVKSLGGIGEIYRCVHLAYSGVIWR
jgi:hypothetical protein